MTGWFHHAANEKWLRDWAFAQPSVREYAVAPMPPGADDDGLDRYEPVDDAYRRMERDGDANQDHHDRFVGTFEWA